MSFKYFNQFLKYSFVGIICQLLDYVLTMILFAKDIDLFLANSIGYLVGSFTSYIGHTKFTFRKTSRKLLTNQQIIFFIFENFTIPQDAPSVLFFIPLTCIALICIDSPKNNTQKLLSFKPILYLGLASYSIYLYHQPLLAFARLSSYEKLDQNSN